MTILKQPTAITTPNRQLGYQAASHPQIGRRHQPLHHGYNGSYEVLVSTTMAASAIRIASRINMLLILTQNILELNLVLHARFGVVFSLPYLLWQFSSDENFQLAYFVRQTLAHNCIHNRFCLAGGSQQQMASQVAGSPCQSWYTLWWSCDS